MEKRRRLSLHSRLALLTSGLLISGGALLIGFLEYQGALAGMGFGEGVLTALFQSVTARTAGFNTIDLIQFTPPTLFIIIFLMFIGASPGSAGGGIKTTSFALFMAILHSRLKGNSHTNIFHRTVPNEVVTKALALAMLAALLISAAIFGLMVVQHPGPATPDNLAAFMVYTFEAVSAFATVGLSIGGTAQLVPLGKVIIILLMFIGRVGLLTVAFSIARRSRGADVEYAQENIMVG
jgi:trk system potassium uptake protein TrkH